MLILGLFSAPADASFDFIKAGPVEGGCLYNNAAVGLSWIG